MKEIEVVENAGDLGAPLTGTGSHPSDQARSGLGASRVDPSRFERPGFDRRLSEFDDALFGATWIAERVLAGQQFNCYERADDCEDDDLDDEDRSYTLCIGPITNARLLCDIEGKGVADVITAALKVATEAFREKIARDTDGSPEGRDAQQLDGEAATAGAEGIAKDQSQ